MIERNYNNKNHAMQAVKRLSTVWPVRVERNRWHMTWALTNRVIVVGPLIVIGPWPSSCLLI